MHNRYVVRAKRNGAVGDDGLMWLPALPSTPECTGPIIGVNSNTQDAAVNACINFTMDLLCMKITDVSYTH